MKYRTSAEAAAAFEESRQRRERHNKAKRVAMVAARNLSPATHPAEREPPLPTRLPLYLPSKTWLALTTHCLEFEMTPNEYIQRCLAASQLSRGGV